jgi:hypothetical protein
MSPFAVGNGKVPLDWEEDPDSGELSNLGDCLRILTNESLLLSLRSFDSDDLGEGVKTPVKELVLGVYVIGLGIELPLGVVRKPHVLVSHYGTTSQKEVN